jgi:hypothetical protein
MLSTKCYLFIHLKSMNDISWTFMECRWNMNGPCLMDEITFPIIMFLGLILFPHGRMPWNSIHPQKLYEWVFIYSSIGIYGWYFWMSIHGMFLKFDFIHGHAFLGVTNIYPLKKNFTWVNQFHPSSIWMIIHPCTFISFDGLKLHIVHKIGHIKVGKLANVTFWRHTSLQLGKVGLD